MQPDPHDTARRLMPLTSSSLPGDSLRQPQPTKKCSTCGRERKEAEFLDRAGTMLEFCGPCRWEALEFQRSQDEHEAMLADLSARVTNWLLARGLSPREAKATMDRVPAEIRGAIPKGSLTALLEGRLPAQGFGLGGNTGGGKTMAVAAILRHAAGVQARAYQPARGQAFGGALRGVRWASWPDTVSWLRSHAIDPAAPERIEELSSAPLLILDDLGRERIKGSYIEDWAASQLDAIVNHRYRHELPILWTTNVTEEDLVGLYGAAMLRRLAADNPLVWLPNLRVVR